MALYCPSCFNNTLTLSKNGVVHIIINGKKMDTGRFLYSLERGREEALYKDLRLKVGEFFEWYSNFQNREPIKKVELVSYDMNCENGCRFNPGQNFSIIDVLIPKAKIATILKELGKKYALEIEF